MFLNKNFNRTTLPPVILLQKETLGNWLSFIIEIIVTRAFFSFVKTTARYTPSKGNISIRTHLPLSTFIFIKEFSLGAFLRVFGFEPGRVYINLLNYLT